MRFKLASLLALGLLIAVLGCSEKRAQRHIEKLNSDNRETRLDASYRLLLMGKSAVDPLVEVARMGDERSRFIAVQLLGKIGNPRAVEPLIEVLMSDSVPLRKAAVEALGKSADERCVLPLIDRLHEDPEPSIRAEATEALRLLRYFEAENALVEALLDSNAEVRKGALVALDSFWDSRLDPIFVKMSEDPDDGVRYIAVQILRHIKFHGALGRLIDMLYDEVPAIRQEAAYALGELGDKRAVYPLMNMLAEFYDNKADREAAQKTLKKLTGSEYEVLE